MEVETSRHNRITAGLVLALIFMVILSFQTQAQTLQLGGWLSSKLFALTGEPDSQILIAQTGQPDSFQVFATSPVMVSGTATGVTFTPGVANSGTATLHGTVSNLNGMPQATVGFRWGYASNNLVNNTTTTTVAGTGPYSIVLTGYDQTQTVYFQAVGVTDGIAYGIGSVFTTTRVITPFTGFETILLVTPLLIWAALIVAMVMTFYIGVHEPNLMDRNITVSLGVVMLIVAIFLFPIVLQVVQNIRLM